MANLTKSKAVVNVGVDVGKHFLDICIHENNKYWREENTAAGIKRILNRLSHYQIYQIVTIIRWIKVCVSMFFDKREPFFNGDAKTLTQCIS